MSSYVMLFVVRPVFVEIKLPSSYSSSQRPLVAGQNIEVKCRTGGSRPAPSITWWKDNKQIPPHLSTVTVSQVSSSSWVHASWLRLLASQSFNLSLSLTCSHLLTLSHTFFHLLWSWCDVCLTESNDRFGCFGLVYGRDGDGDGFWNNDRTQTMAIWLKADWFWRQHRKTMAATWFVASKIQWFQLQSSRIRSNLKSHVSQISSWLFHLCIRRPMRPIYWTERWMARSKKLT